MKYSYRLLGSWIIGTLTIGKGEGGKRELLRRLARMWGLKQSDFEVWRSDCEG